MEESARVCLPDAVRIHIKDGRMERGNVKFLLPGDGKIPLPWPACAGTADRERLGEGCAALLRSLIKCACESTRYSEV